MTTKNRRPARKVALQALYELDCTHHPIEQVVSLRLDDNQMDGDLRLYTYQIIHGVLDRKLDIDRVIQRFAPEWPLDQVAIIDRNLLRIAIYEFAISRNTPAKVAINEAVDLAKEFGSESASRFVNGVLGALMVHEAELGAMLEGSSGP